MKKYFFLLILLIGRPEFIHAEIVDTSKVYTYEELTDDIQELRELYPRSLSVDSISTTLYGRKIWAVKVGKGKHAVLIHGAHHAREWLTSSLLMNMIESYAHNYEEKKGETEILDQVSIWFVPMVNPDGVTLQQHGAQAFPLYLQPYLLKMNNGSENFMKWKANLEGIDLNRQYPASWEHLRGVKNKPYYQYYKGTKPFEANEVKALAKFTKEIKPEIAVAYHSSGNVLFWGYPIWGLTHTTEYTDDFYTIAEKVAELTTYPIEEPASHQQGGGYTDWFIEEFDKPAFTVEIGNLIEESSVPLEEYPVIWEQNKDVGLLVATQAWERLQKR